MKINNIIEAYYFFVFWLNEQLLNFSQVILCSS